MAAKQRLTKGRGRARHLKTRRIAVLLGLSIETKEEPFSNYLSSAGTSHMFYGISCVFASDFPVIFLLFI